MSESRSLTKLLRAKMQGPEDILASSKSSKPKRIKRPMNAFMVWSSVERKKLAQKEPRLHNTELSKRLGLAWKTMTEHDKLPYRQEADRLKSKLMEEHPEYKYKPKRRKYDATNRHSLWRNVKVHGNIIDTPTKNSPAACSSTSSYCIVQPHGTTVWNNDHLSPMKDKTAYDHKRINPVNANNPALAGYNVPSFYTSPAVPYYGVPFQLASTVQTSYVYKAEKISATSSKIIPLPSSSNYDGDIVPNNPENPFNEIQSKNEPDSDVRFPLEAPPCSPYTSSTTTTPLPFMLDVYKESTRSQFFGPRGH